MFFFQLLGCALKEERPELESRRTELLQQEEQLRLELHSLQEAVLRQLASADGNILQNKVMLFIQKINYFISL